MVKNIIGFILVDAPHSALNNAGKDAGDRTDNIVRVKSIKKNGRVYPYVSGQALRYWWRNTLKTQFNWELSPIIRADKIAFTKTNPIDYPDDDVFGYMRTNQIDNPKKKNPKEVGTVTRISPLKNSPLISVLGQYPTNDFGVMGRQEGDPVPFEHEFYSTIFKGIFAIDITNVGRFSEIKKTGYKNMYPDLIEIANQKGLIHEGNEWILDKKIRLKRIKDVINAIPYIAGGASNTSHLTDVSPNLLILTSISTGNNIFMNLVREEDGQLIFDIDAFNEVLEDYKDKLTSKIYIGFRKGFLPDVYQQLEEYAEKHENVEFGSIKEITDKFTNQIDELI